MNLLIAAATSMEIAPLLQHLQAYRVENEKNSYMMKDLQVGICITGIGCISATYTLEKYLTGHTIDLAVQAGIAGAFSRDIPLGTVLGVKNEILGDLGAEDKEQFNDLFDMGFLTSDEYPYHQKKLPWNTGNIPFLNDLKAVDAITVNTVSGKQSTINLRLKKYHPVLESMEGAAFHYVCLMGKIPFTQIRSVSNYVEVRDKSKWNIPLALKNLNEFLIQWVEDISLLGQ